MPVTMDAADIDGFLGYTKHQRLVEDYAYLAAAAVLVYDYFLTIHLEIRLVWFSPWTYTKVIFLLTRYIPITSVYFFLHIQLFPDVLPASCVVTVPVASWLLSVGVFMAEAIFLLRTWVVLSRSRRVGIFLVILFTGCLIAAFVNNSQFLNSLRYGLPPYNEFRGCLVIDYDKSLLEQFIILTASDAILLVFVTISAIRAYRSGSGGELSQVIHRDAVLFYVCLLVVPIASVIIAHIIPAKNMVMLCPLQSAFHSTLASRTILNLRIVARRQDSTTVSMELYSDNIEIEAHMEFGVWNCFDEDDFDLDAPSNERFDGDLEAASVTKTSTETRWSVNEGCSGSSPA